MILVTGYKGFIGSRLAQRLVEENEVIVGLDAVDGDPNQRLSLVPWHKITKVYHQGAISDTTETDVDKIYHYNVKFSIDLFTKAIEHQIPVVYASSASVYGNSKSQSYNPLNYYAMSKLTVDMWVLDNIKSFNSIVGYRYFNVYGRDENKTDWTMSPVCKFIKQAKEDRIIKVFSGSQDMKRDFICIEDVLRIVTREPQESGIFDLGTCSAMSFLEVAELVAQKYDASIKFIPFPEKLRNKYQFYTEARTRYPHWFKTVRQWLNEFPISNPFPGEFSSR